MAQHAILPPSSADKWMVCTAWREAVKGLPSRSSIYADEGTAAHELLEVCLRLDQDPFQMTKDLDLADNLASVTNWLSDYRVANDVEDWFIEHRLWFGQAIGHPKLSGSSDLVVVAKDELVITDYKHGAGVIVDVTTTKQLRLYLVGAIHEFGPRPQYRLVIFQPRGRTHEEPIREHVVTQKEIAKFTKEAKDAADKNLNGTGERKAGAHCQFCSAAPKCKALALFALGVAVEEFGTAGPP